MRHEPLTGYMSARDYVMAQFCESEALDLITESIFPLICAMLGARFCMSGDSSVSGARTTMLAMAGEYCDRQHPACGVTSIHLGHALNLSTLTKDHIGTR